MLSRCLQVGRCLQRPARSILRKDALRLTSLAMNSGTRAPLWPASRMFATEADLAMDLEVVSPSVAGEEKEAAIRIPVQKKNVPGSTKKLNRLAQLVSRLVDAAVVGGGRSNAPLCVARS